MLLSASVLSFLEQRRKVNTDRQDGQETPRMWALSTMAGTCQGCGGAIDPYFQEEHCCLEGQQSRSGHLASPSCGGRGSLAQGSMEARSAAAGAGLAEAAAAPDFQSTSTSGTLRGNQVGDIKTFQEGPSKGLALLRLQELRDETGRIRYGSRAKLEPRSQCYREADFSGDQERLLSLPKVMAQHRCTAEEVAETRPGCPGPSPLHRTSLQSRWDKPGLKESLPFVFMCLPSCLSVSAGLKAKVASN